MQDPTQPPAQLDLARLMQEQHGMTFDGLSDNNLPIYKKASGEEQEIDVGQMASSMGLDPATTKINYNTPDTPLNQVPDVVTAGTRAALAAGNEKGGINYLKGLGLEEVQYNPQLGFVGKENGIWKAIDPQGLGSGTAWDKTKEAMRDLADQTFTATNVAGQVAAAGLTEGASIGAEAVGSGIIGGLNEAMRLSFGRALGTYEATPDEVKSDLAKEMTLNAGGAVFAAGVRPGVEALASGLRKTYAAFKDAPQAAKDIWANSVGAIGPGEQNVSKVFEEGPAIAARLQEAGSKYGRFNGHAIDEGLTNDQIAQVKEAATKGPSAFSALYSKMRNDVIESIPKDFKSSSDDIVDPMRNALADLNIGKWVDNSGRLIPSEEVAATTQARKEFENGINFKLLDQKELLAKAHDLSPESEIGALKNQIPGFLATSQEGQALVKKLDSALEIMSDSGEGSGKAAAARLINQAKTIKDILHTMSEQAREGTLGPVQAAIGKLQSTVGNSISGVLNKGSPEAADKYAQLLTTYSKAKTAFAPFSLAADRAAKQGSDLPYQTLLNQVATRSSRATVQGQKNALESMIDTLSSNSEGSSALKNMADEFANHKNEIEILNAAKAFAPITKGGVSLGVSGGGGAAAGSALGGPMGAAIGAAGGILSQSPRAAYYATRVVNKMLPKGATLSPGATAEDATINAIYSAKKLIENLPKQHREALIQNPNALKALINSVAIVPALHQQVQQHMATQIGQQQQ